VLAGCRVLVAGASGFVGRRLTKVLEQDGYAVRAMTRHPDDYRGQPDLLGGEPVLGDALDPETLPAALEGCSAAYYLIHSLSSPDFARMDADAARAFGQAAADAGVQQIVYLGGLGDDFDTLSPHLRSRRQVEGLLGGGGVPVTVLRAGIVVGDQGLSWEITRQLVEHLPAMITPRWVRTRTQPIAVDDVICYLVGVLGHPDTLGPGLRGRWARNPALLHHAQASGRNRTPTAADCARTAAESPALVVVASAGDRRGYPCRPRSGGLDDH
jgi:uncharacterized protein YbjT (DUF2867 family)